MPETKSFPELIEYRYGDRGGYKGLIRLLSAKLPYEVRIENVKAQYRVSTRTAQRYYERLRLLGVL